VDDGCGRGAIDDAGISFP